jgi:putative protease
MISRVWWISLKKSEKIEILAPAGGFDSVKAAIFSGADAIYMGGSFFGARAFAENFNDEMISETVKFARARGVKIHLTVNTLLKEKELSDVVKFVKFLCSIPVDAILVQDMGLFRIMRKICPEMPIHCSTQMSLHTPEGVCLMREMGASRVVLARELSYDEINEISKKTDIEIEAFVHGALCMSVSGQCYFSAMLGSRSGNRGKCAQPCRLPFSDGKYRNVLSLKDLSAIKDIGLLSDTGVCSAKIEGRMKRPEYVAAAVNACRSMRDYGSVPEKDLTDLENIFSRSGFTNGYLTGHTGREMFGIRTKDDVTSASKDVFGRIHELYRREYQKIPVNMQLKASTGCKPSLIMSDGINTVIAEEDILLEKAIKEPLSDELCEKQLGKLGNTPFSVGKISVFTDGECSLPVSVMNSLRRKCCEQLIEIRSKAEPVRCGEWVQNRETNHLEQDKPEIRAVFYDSGKIDRYFEGLGRIYIPLEASLQEYERLRNLGYSDISTDLPRAFFGGENEVSAAIEERAGLSKTFLCGNIGSAALCRKLKVRWEGAYSLNIMNSEALEFFEDLGAEDAELSYELTLREAEDISGSINRGIMAYGRQPLMLTRNCPLAFDGCRNCSSPETITDRTGTSFPVMCRKGTTYRMIEILNSVPVTLADRQHEIHNSDYLILRFTTESSDEIARIIRNFIRREKPDYKYTRGLWYRGVE